MSGVIQFPDPSSSGPTVPTADATANVYERDVGGNKADAAVTTVGTTKTTIAYVKGILGNLHPTLITTVPQDTLVTGDEAYSAYQVLVTSLATTCVYAIINGAIKNTGATALVSIDVAAGGGGSEVFQAGWYGDVAIGSVATSSMPFTIIVPLQYAAGTRLTIRAKQANGTAGTVALRYSFTAYRI